MSPNRCVCAFVRLCVCVCPGVCAGKLCVSLAMLDMIEYQKPVAKRKSLACIERFPRHPNPSPNREQRRVENLTSMTLKGLVKLIAAHSYARPELKSAARFRKVLQVAQRELPLGCWRSVVQSWVPVWEANFLHKPANIFCSQIMP